MGWTKLDLNTGFKIHNKGAYGMGNGTTTSALFYGGDEVLPLNRATELKWDGSNWTEVADLNTGRGYLEQGMGVNAEAAIML